MRKHLTMSGIVFGTLLGPISAGSRPPPWDLVLDAYISDLAIDRTADKLYWTYQSSIYRSNLDGSEIEHWAGPLLEAPRDPYYYEQSWGLSEFYIAIDLEGSSLFLSMDLTDRGDTPVSFTKNFPLDDWPPDDGDHYLAISNRSSSAKVYDYDDEIDDRIKDTYPSRDNHPFAFDPITEEFYWVEVEDGILRGSHIDYMGSEWDIEVVQLEYDESACPIIDMIAHDGRVYWVSQENQILTWKWEVKDGGWGSIVEVIDGDDIANINTGGQGTSWGTLKATH